MRNIQSGKYIDCICLLHMNELALRALVKSLDRETTGPKSFTGPLGKLLTQYGDG